jgi:WD40 repeat protein
MAEATCKAYEFARIVTAFPEYPEAVQAIDVSPDGRTLALAGSQGHMTIWDTASGELRHDFAKQNAAIGWVRFAPDGKTLAFGVGGQIRRWDMKTESFLEPLGQTSDAPSCCGAFSPDGRLLASGTHEQRIRAWDLATGRERPPLVGHLGRVSAVAFAPDGRTLASGSWDRSVRLWSVAAWQEVANLEGHQGRVACLTFASRGTILVSGSDALPGEIRCWRTTR